MSTNNVVLVGNARSGKSAFMQRIEHGTFSPGYSATLPGTLKSLRLGESVLHDIGCSGDALSRKVQLQGANVAAVFFSVADPASLRDVSRWCEEVRGVSPGVKFVLVATHTDLYSLNSQQVRETTSLSLKYGAYMFLISSCTGEGIEDLATVLGA